MDYLNFRKQQTKVGPSFSNWSEIKHRIPQNYIPELFFVTEKSDIYNFADDNTLYFCGANLKIVLENLEHDASYLIIRFSQTKITLFIFVNSWVIRKTKVFC